MINELRTVKQESYTVEKTVDHIQISKEQYWRSATQTVARSFEVHEQVKSYQKTVNQWQQSSSQFYETASQWQEGSNQYKYGAVQWLRTTYQVNVLDSSGEVFSVPSPERCIVPGTALQGSTPTNLSCADVVSYGGNGPPSNPAGDGNSSAMRYDNSTTCADLVAGGTGTWNGSTYSVIDSNSPYVHTDCKAGPATAAYGPVAAVRSRPRPPRLANSWTKTTCDQILVPAAPIAACTYGPGPHTDANQVVTTCTHTVNTAGGVSACTYGKFAPCRRQPGHRHVHPAGRHQLRHGSVAAVYADRRSAAHGSDDVRHDRLQQVDRCGHHDGSKLRVQQRVEQREQLHGDLVQRAEHDGRHDRVHGDLRCRFDRVRRVDG